MQTSTMELWHLLLDRVRETPDRTYLLYDGRSASYAQVASSAESLGRQLRQRCGDDPVICVSCDSAEHLLHIVWACAFARISLAYIPHFAAVDEVRRTMSQVGARWLLTDLDALHDEEWVISASHALERATSTAANATWHEDDDRHDPLQHDRRTDPAILFQTSGTSGEPKWVRCEFWKCREAVESMWYTGALQHAIRQTVFLTAPLFHSYGLSSLFEYTRGGSTLALPTGRSPLGPVGELRQAQLSRQVTSIEGVPNFHLQLSQLIGRLQLPALRHIGFGGGALDEAAVTALRERHADLTYSVRYGLTETPSVVCHKVFAPPYAGNWRSSGRTVPAYRLTIERGDGSSCEVGEEGEIVIRGSCVCNYLGELSSGMLRTGDLGFLTVEGELVVAGRRSTFLKHRGYRLSPELIESAIRDFPGIDDCRALMSDGRLVVEIVCGETVSTSTLLMHAARKLPAYAVPEYAIRVEGIPRTRSGKVKRH